MTRAATLLLFALAACATPEAAPPAAPTAPPVTTQAALNADDADDAARCALLRAQHARDLPTEEIARWPDPSGTLARCLAGATHRFEGQRAIALLAELGTAEAREALSAVAKDPALPAHARQQAAEALARASERPPR